jgi:3-deoxy-7-phosphoheptulonate synthase
MSHPSTENLNVAALEAMPTPAALHREHPLGDEAARTVLEGRRAIVRVLRGEDPRRIAIVGPCSIHDPVAGLEYAARLAALARQVQDTLHVVMRIYFEKPRTSVGWKGFINDPHMDDSFRIAEGMSRARRFLLDVAGLGLPAATEALDPVAPQYLGDLVSWTAIGARTSESQTHREMASGLSTPVGFKNGTDGEMRGAVNAIVSAAQPHAFLGISPEGVTSVVRTRGNPNCHLVLRGGGGRGNFDEAGITRAEEALRKAGLPAAIVVDCSHENSGKVPERQALVLEDGLARLRAGKRSIIGWMIESNLVAGNQAIPRDLSQLLHGCSVTDACIGWDDTERLLRHAAQVLRTANPL